LRQRNSNPAIAAFQNAACQSPLEDLILRPFFSLCLDQKMNGGQCVKIKTFELEDPDESDSDISIKVDMGWYKIVADH
jgi:hypothetical protein